MSKKRIKLSLTLFVLAAFVCTVLWLTGSPSVQGHAPSKPQATQSENPLAELNRKAKASKGTDPLAIYDVTDGVVATFAPVELPFFTREAIKERIARAELNYRHGVDKGISEVKVAKAINELADKFELPTYAKVSVAMVRTARVLLMLQLPNLIGQDNRADKKHTKKKIGSSINPFMSPLEATTLTLFLLQQKKTNEAFQFSHKEFYENLHQKQMEKWTELGAKKDSGTREIVEPQTGPSMQGRSNEKTDAIRQGVKAGAAKMSPDALLHLADSSMDTLGINR